MKQVAAQNQVSDDTFTNFDLASPETDTTIFTFNLAKYLRPFKGFGKQHSAINQLEYSSDLKRKVQSGEIEPHPAIAISWMKSLRKEKLYKLTDCFEQGTGLDDMMLLATCLVALEQNRSKISYTHSRCLEYMMALHYTATLVSVGVASGIEIDFLPPIHAFDLEKIDRSILAAIEANCEGEVV